MSHETLAGGFSGAAMGAKYGPVGAVVGFGIGAVFGSSMGRKRKKEKRRQLRVNTEQSYRITEATYGGIKQSRGNIANEYARNMATDFSKFAASGRTLNDDARNQIVGRNAQVRDSALSDVQIQEDKFKTSSAYSFLEKDYNYIAGRETDKEFNVTGRSGESFFTQKQQGMLRSITDESNELDRPGMQIFNKYRESIIPTFEEYQAYKFGDQQAKSDFQLAMTDRIKKANQVFDDDVMLSRAARIQRDDARDRMDYL